ncbi:MAG: hypothetical protein ACOYMM_06540 [Phycisphaerales bacterium]
MKPASKFSPYRRAEFLQSVAAKDRAMAERLCDLLEAAFAPADIQIYSGFPIVVRDMEWIAGFAMRASGPVAYCCSAGTLAEMGAELTPYMSGKSCVAVKPRKGESVEVVLALVARAFKAASRHGGMISKTDLRKREAARQKASAGSAASPAKPAPKKPAPKKSVPKKTVPKKTGAKKTSAKSSATAKPSSTRVSSKKQAPSSKRAAPAKTKGK